MVDQIKGSMMGGSSAQSLSGRAARSGAWIGGGFVVQRGLQFASNLILTRLLFPEAFGLMALCSVFLVGLAMFSDLGLKPAIIRDARGTDPDFLNTAWTIQIIRGLVLFVCGCLLAYPISVIYDRAILFPLLATLSTTAAITGFASIKLITAERDLNFRTVTFIQIAGQVLSSIRFRAAEPSIHISTLCCKGWTSRRVSMICGNRSKAWSKNIRTGTLARPCSPSLN